MYFIGTFTKLKDAPILEKSGFDAVSNYIFLADWKNSKKKPIQKYSELVGERESDWNRIREEISIPYYPTAVPGWDAWPRAEHIDFEDAAGHYPHTPVVIESTAENFGMMLEKSMDYIQSANKDPLFDCVIAAWNEMSEGCSLLPRVHYCDGRIMYDDSMIMKTRSIIDGFPKY
ncbi:hypothetical protein GF327_07310 [Candidatus Woesearchaeota archaeon]|nr:hypothetical protein [Candidatus Woesearchaeota archaeon]